MLEASGFYTWATKYLLLPCLVASKKNNNNKIMIFNNRHIITALV